MTYSQFPLIVDSDFRVEYNRFNFNLMRNRKVIARLNI